MTTVTSSTPSEPILLWPNGAPDLPDNIDEEQDTTPPTADTPPGQHIMRLGNVSKPTITIYRPAPEKDTGAAVVVCPGGGYHILAYNLEGTEVCEWLNSIGVTGVLLKYRVPGRLTNEHKGPLQDAQRALSLVRHHAKEWGLDPARLGILGFSAGGHLSAMASTNYETRWYEAIDEADTQSCRPDFALLIYAAYLANSDFTAISPALPVNAQTSPAFIVQTQDDTVHVENSYIYGLALKAAGVPAEVHIYLQGGHGYGLRPSPNPVCHWPERAAEWMAAMGYLNKK